MSDLPKIKSDVVLKKPSETAIPAKTVRLLLRLLRASQPVARIELARRLGINRSIVTDTFKPLINAGLICEEPLQPINTSRLQGRPPISLSFNDNGKYFAGISLGVRLTQVGLTTLSGQTLAEDEFETPADSLTAVKALRTSLEKLCAKIPDQELTVIGISVPGVTDAARRRLLYAPHLDWRDIEIATELENIRCGKKSADKIRVVVENDATAAAVYESRLRLKKTTGGILKDFILVRSGTGIGVGLIMNGEVYRGTGKSEGVAGEFGHTTIVAGGKLCVCGNRGCWERYAAAAAASSLYTGDRMQLGNAKPPRYVEIVERAEAGEIRAIRTLEKIGEYLGIGISNVITGLGVPHVILSGRIVYGWKFIRKPLKEAINNSLAGKLTDWSIEPGEPRGAGLGGAFEVAVEEYLSYGFSHVI